MKLLPALAALATAAVISVGVAVPAASAVEPIVVLGPANGSTIVGAFPKFTWTPPADPYAFVQLDVSTKRNLAADGTLQQSAKRPLHLSTVEPETGVYQDTSYSFEPGVYCWHLIVQDIDNNTMSSAVQKFVVPIVVEVTKARVTTKKAAYNGARGIAVNATVRCNQAEPVYYMQFIVDVYKGKKKIGTSRQARGDCVGMYRAKAEGWIEPRSLKGGLTKGTKLTLKVYAASTHRDTAKGYPKYASKKTTLTYVWKG